MRSFVNIMQISVTDLTPCVFCATKFVGTSPLTLNPLEGNKFLGDGWSFQNNLNFCKSVVVEAAKKVENPTRITQDRV